MIHIFFIIPIIYIYILKNTNSTISKMLCYWNVQLSQFNIQSISTTSVTSWFWCDEVQQGVYLYIYIDLQITHTCNQDSRVQVVTHNFCHGFYQICFLRFDINNAKNVLKSELFLCIYLFSICWWYCRQLITTDSFKNTFIYGISSDYIIIFFNLSNENYSMHYGHMQFKVNGGTDKCQFLKIYLTI